MPELSSYALLMLAIHLASASFVVGYFSNWLGTVVLPARRMAKVRSRRYLRNDFSYLSRR